VPNPFSAFERLDRAYLEFARTEPAYYSAMFEGGIPLEVSQELRDAGERAFAVIRSAAERLVAQIPAAQRPPAFMVALHVWSLAHGIASLFGRGDAGRRQLPMPPEELLERPACWFISAGSDFPKAAPFRQNGITVTTDQIRTRLVGAKLSQSGRKRLSEVESYRFGDLTFTPRPWHRGRSSFMYSHFEV
jgi:Tetracyclin repressor-like, C-terminal domain